LGHHLGMVVNFQLMGLTWTLLPLLQVCNVHCYIIPFSEQYRHAWTGIYRGVHRYSQQSTFLLEVLSACQWCSEGFLDFLLDRMNFIILFWWQFGNGSLWSLNVSSLCGSGLPKTGTRAAVQQLVEEHMHEIVDEWQIPSSIPNLEALCFGSCELG
jgi:hypothetical protein